MSLPPLQYYLDHFITTHKKSNMLWTLTPPCLIQGIEAIIYPDIGWSRLRKRGSCHHQNRGSCLIDVLTLDHYTLKGVK